VKIDPGELDQRVKHKRWSNTPDGAGGQTRTLETLNTYLAKVRPITENKHVNAQAMYMFIFRWRTTFMDADVLEWRGINYNIRFLNDRGSRSSYITINAERGVAA